VQETGNEKGEEKLYRLKKAKYKRKVTGYYNRTKKKSVAEQKRGMSVRKD
jgi:hypothetical protein